MNQPEPVPPSLTETPIRHLEDLRRHGETDRLRAELERLGPSTCGSAAEFESVVAMADELGLDDVVRDWLAAKHDRGLAGADDLRRLAHRAASRQADETALELLGEALRLDPGSLPAVRERVILLGRLGRADEADRFLSEQAGRFPAASLEPLRETLRERPAQPPETPGSDTPWNDGHLLRFLSLFGGRPGVHAQQWVSPSGGQGYTPVHQQLTPNLVDLHFAGRRTLGVYQLDEACMVRWVAFDVDIRKDAVSEAIKNRTRWGTLLRDAFQVAAALADVAAVEGIPSVLEHSGFKGYHVWVPLEKPVEAAVARAFAECLAANLDRRPPEIGVEIFPKQTRLQGKNLGNLIKLPLGVHLRTGRRSCFVGAGGEEIADPWEYLFEIKLAEVRPIQRLARHRTADSTRFDSWAPPPPGGEAAPAPEAPAAGGELPWETAGPVAYDPESDDRLQHLLSRCGILAGLMEKAQATGELTYEEQISLVHTLGHLETGPAAVNHILGGLTRPAQDLFLKSRLRGSPASCSRLRSRVSSPDLPPCRCDFGDAPESYPNPLLHIKEFSGATSAREEPLRDFNLRAQALVRRFLDLRERLRHVQADHDGVERALLDLLQEAGEDHLNTSMGTFRVSRAEDGSTRFRLEL